MKTILAFCCVASCCLASQGNDVLVVAHRGASKRAPENTIPAFNLAWKNGADAIEGDFYLSSDGEIVCIHDADTERVSNRKLVVRNSTSEKLLRLDVGRWKGKKWIGTKIPLISEVFATVPVGKKIYVEIKCGIEILPKLITEIERSGLEDHQVVVICFDQKVIKAVKARAPQFKAYWLLSVKRDALLRLQPTTAQTIAVLKDSKADGLSSNHKNITKSYVNAVLAAGFEHHVWTVDREVVARRMKNWGVKSITTNDPGPILKTIGRTKD